MLSRITSSAFYRRSCRLRGRSTGFTLIELMVVITVMAALLAVGLPSFKDFITGQRVKTAAFSFVNAAVYARSEAIKRNTDVSMVANAGGWKTGWTIMVGANKLGEQESVGDSVMIRSIDPKPTATQVTYQSSGRLLVAVDDLQVSDDANGHARCISFDLSGLPKSRMGACPP